MAHKFDPSQACTAQVKGEPSSASASVSSLSSPSSAYLNIANVTDSSSLGLVQSAVAQDNSSPPLALDGNVKGGFFTQLSSSSASGSLWSLWGGTTSSWRDTSSNNTNNQVSLDKSNQSSCASLNQLSTTNHQSQSPTTKGAVASIFGHFKRNTAPNIVLVDNARESNNNSHCEHDSTPSSLSSSTLSLVSSQQQLDRNDTAPRRMSDANVVSADHHSDNKSHADSSSTSVTKSTVHDLTSEHKRHTMDVHRFRCQVKYIGNAVLHKNFTLPMLEWIAKDVKRQATKGAKSTSQRHITIPARDIVFEIASNQLKASSCKDGHCLFVHPMQNVSKYAQLQHDPTCFSYLIRDYKDSPYTCHVFQAKNSKKVHEIFMAIREAAAKFRTESLGLNNPLAGNISSLSSVSDGSPQAASSQLRPSLAAAVGDVSGSAAVGAPTQAVMTPRSEPPSQFNNSYQFEVMFVKKVKLQCRRVPTTFVDDALETLKSFEVLKSNEPKTQGGAGKRSIAVSVDERQEYDESCQSPSVQSDPANPNKSRENNDEKLDESTGGVESSPMRVASCNEQTRSQLSVDKKEPPGASNEDTGSNNSIDTCGQNFHKSARNQIQKGEEILKLPLTQSFSVDAARDHINNVADDERKISRDNAKKSLSNKFGLGGNDFSPYNTIISSDLNDCFAAMPVLSSSVSLDHETRQKLARQVRETIMASGALVSSRDSSSNDHNNNDNNNENDGSSPFLSGPKRSASGDILSMTSNIVKSSSAKDIGGNSDALVIDASSSSNNYQATNNFDLFRRASTRQVVKNRTMLLLIAKDELCTISTDKHQVLFNKSFNSILHCLQGTKNNDHFGLICRDSGKINPNTESYAGFIFKCQSDKVVREVMAALKQVIHNSQHGYHTFNSPYNPLNTPTFIAANAAAAAAAKHRSVPSTPLTTTASSGASSTPVAIAMSGSADVASSTHPLALQTVAQFKHPISVQNKKVTQPQPVRPNPIKSMFCDDCPMYWFHRLCCDLESMPSETSKSIILRRLDTSLSDMEQDEILSKFSDFKIESVEEHNEIFMSLLRHLCERKQLRHGQSHGHNQAMAAVQAANELALNPHQQQQNQGQQQLQQTGVGALAIGNLMKAKKSISSSIENMLKRRPSLRDETAETLTAPSRMISPTRAGMPAKNLSVDCGTSKANLLSLPNAPSQLQRSQSINETTQASQQQLQQSDSSESDNSLLHRRRSSTFGSNSNNESPTHDIGTLSLNITATQVRNDSFDMSKSPGVASSEQPPTSPNLTFRFGEKNHPASNVAKQQVNSRSLATEPLSMFWKKNIYDKIRLTAAHVTGSDTVNDQLIVNTTTAHQDDGDDATSSTNGHTKRSRGELRQLWRKAIDEQITLIKMDKQNQLLLKADAEHDRTGNNTDDDGVKLNYDDIKCPHGVSLLWDKILAEPANKKIDFNQVYQLIRKGVPRRRRGQVWLFLMNQYQLRHGTYIHKTGSDFRGDANQAYRELLSQLSVQQHEILVDLGRTFPNHPYYAQSLGLGQLSMFNLLKAYSLLDQQVGYCQGLSFVAGILLLHANEEDEAFELMRHLLFNLGLRKQYLPSMTALQLQLYQLTRLLRDFEYDIFLHFDRYDVSASLYAAPWFLTVFASQLSLGYVARLMDAVFLVGIEAIFRFSISLLSFHRLALLECNSLESTMDYIKTKLVDIEPHQMAQITDKSMGLDLRNNLIDYEIEYSFYRAQDCTLKASSMFSNNNVDSIDNYKSHQLALMPYSQSNDQQQFEEKNRKQTSTTPTNISHRESSTSDSTAPHDGGSFFGGAVNDQASMVAAAAAALLQQLMSSSTNATTKSQQSMASPDCESQQTGANDEQPQRQNQSSISSLTVQ